jgi:hypothetical protein
MTPFWMIDNAQTTDRLSPGIRRSRQAGIMASSSGNATVRTHSAKNVPA